MRGTGIVLAGLTLALIAAGCAPSTGEGVSACRGAGDCPAMFPVCRADMRCWSTSEPSADAGVVGDGGADSGRDAGRADAGDAASAIDAHAEIDMGSATPDAASDSGSTDDSGTDAATGIDVGTMSVDAGTDAAATASDAGQDAASTAADANVDGGGPCGGAPMTAFCRDMDADGRGATSSGTMMRCAAGGGYVASCDDCNDTNGSVHQGAPELCNNIDDNCDGTIDGAAASASCTVAHGVGVCIAGGTCDIGSCTAPYDDCDAIVSTGCETDTSTSAANCGSCGSSCGAADTCSASNCDLSPIEQVSTNAAATVDQVSCIRRANGHIACWGATFSRVPVVAHEIVGVTDATDIDLEYYTTCIARRSSPPQCWATGGTTPTFIDMTGIPDAVEVAAGRNIMCARRSTGRVVCANYEGGTFAISGVLNGVDLVSYYDNFRLSRADGTVLFWTPTASPGSMPNTPGTLAVSGETAVGVGGGLDCGTTSSGVTCLLGAGRCTFTGYATQSLVPGMSGSFSDVVVGGPRLDYCGAHACAISATGTLYCFGQNMTGQIGVASPGFAATAVAVPGMTNITSVSAGAEYTCAVQNRAVVYCWGDNDFGQLGDGTTTNSSSPVLVHGL